MTVDETIVAPGPTRARNGLFSSKPSQDSLSGAFPANSRPLTMTRQGVVGGEKTVLPDAAAKTSVNELPAWFVTAPAAAARTMRWVETGRPGSLIVSNRPFRSAGCMGEPARTSVPVATAPESVTPEMVPDVVPAAP